MKVPCSCRWCVGSDGCRCSLFSSVPRSICASLMRLHPGIYRLANEGQRLDFCGLLSSLFFFWIIGVCFLFLVWILLGLRFFYSFAHGFLVLLFFSLFCLLFIFGFVRIPCQFVVLVLLVLCRDIEACRLQFNLVYLS